MYWKIMVGISHKILRLRITIARKRKAGQDHNKNEDAFEDGESLVKEDTEELAEK
jgi:hypothetical protein